MNFVIVTVAADQCADFYKSHAPYNFNYSTPRVTEEKSSRRLVCWSRIMKQIIMREKKPNEFLLINFITLHWAFGAVNLWAKLKDFPFSLWWTCRVHPGALDCRAQIVIHRRHLCGVEIMLESRCATPAVYTTNCTMFIDHWPWRKKRFR